MYILHTSNYGGFHHYATTTAAVGNADDAAAAASFDFYAFMCKCGLSVSLSLLGCISILAIKSQRSEIAKFLREGAAHE